MELAFKLRCLKTKFFKLLRKLPRNTIESDLSQRFGPNKGIEDTLGFPLSLRPHFINMRQIF